MRKLKLSLYYIQELKYRLIYVGLGTALLFFTTYNYKQGLIFIVLPKGLSHFISSGLTEIFFTYLQLCINISFSFAILASFIQIYLFLRPGFYTYESKSILNLLIFALSFYVFVYTCVFPLLINLLWSLFYAYSQNFIPIHLSFELRLKDYLENIHKLNTILGFSLPYILCLNIIQKHTNKKFWAYYRGLIYTLSFFIASFITPPDVLSQTLVGLPLIIFYEIQVLLWTLYKTYQEIFLVRQPIKPYKNTLRKEKQR